MDVPLQSYTFLCGSEIQVDIQHITLFNYGNMNLKKILAINDDNCIVD